MHWLSRDPRLRASIVIAAHNTELAVAEIERRADDMRFVQVLMLVSGEVTLGRRQLWPIYRLAEKLGLPIGVHAGSAYRTRRPPWDGRLIMSRTTCRSPPRSKINCRA